MRKYFALMSALSAAIFSARQSGISDISNTKIAKQAAAYGANGIWMPSRSRRIKNKIKARQKRS